LDIYRDPPDMSGLEISEETAFEMANWFRAWIEEGIRWMFRVSAEREWFVFAGTVAGLGLLSYVGTLTDLLTLIYTGNLFEEKPLLSLVSLQLSLSSGDLVLLQVL